ncbi:hypothetical protein L1887_44300 [Cichorium endivia]|nr:hypothetical protein L1887_44300 [Cichorium endivia]
MFRLKEEFKLLIGRGSVKSSNKAAVGGVGGYLDSDDDEDEGFNDVEILVAHPVSDYNLTIDALPFEDDDNDVEIEKWVKAINIASSVTPPLPPPPPISHSWMSLEEIRGINQMHIHGIKESNLP